MNPIVTQQLSITFMTGDTVKPSPSLLQHFQSPNIATTMTNNITTSYAPIKDINTYLMKAANLLRALTTDEIAQNQSQIGFTLNILESFELAMRNCHSPQSNGAQPITTESLINNVELLTEVIGNQTVMMDSFIESLLKIVQESNPPSSTQLASPFPHYNWRATSLSPRRYFPFPPPTYLRYR